MYGNTYIQSDLHTLLKASVRKHKHIVHMHSLFLIITKNNMHTKFHPSSLTHWWMRAQVKATRNTLISSIDNGHPKHRKTAHYVKIFAATESERLPGEVLEKTVCVGVYFKQHTPTHKLYICMQMMLITL